MAEIVRMIAEKRRTLLARCAAAVTPNAADLVETAVPQMVADAVEQRTELAALLYLLRVDLHPVHANTAHHGRGVGGQSFTGCCHVLDPDDPAAARVLELIDRALGVAVHGGDERVARRIEQIRSDSGG